jgi:hypothetical protein
MTKIPDLDPESRNYISCPHCTIQIPEDVPACPYCLQPVVCGTSGTRRDIRELLAPPERFPRLRQYCREHAGWMKVIGPALLGALALWLSIGYLTQVRVVVPTDNVFLIEAERERKEGGRALLTGKLTNRGEDIPDLSLRSIGVIAEFRFDDGRTERRRVFPKSPFRGEGALLHGESGAFEMDVPKGVKSVTLRGEIVDLGETRGFDPVSRRVRRLPIQRRR